MHAQHEKGLIILLMQQLGFIFNIPWQDKTSDKVGKYPFHIYAAEAGTYAMVGSKGQDR